MSDRPDCTHLDDQPPAEAPFVHVSAFRESALLLVPTEWRASLRHLGRALYDLGLERWGYAPETTDGAATTRAQIRAVAADLRSSADLLAELAHAPEETDMNAAEARMCRRAGTVGDGIRESASSLDALGSRA